ncbi:unnamed protein product, partial [Tetraodon nigroviridis]
MEELTIWEQHTITLTKDPKFGFGFAISGGKDKPHPDSGDTTVVVSDVLPNGPAMGRLFTKDQIVMVNGVSMENVHSNYTIQILKTCGKTANVVSPDEPVGLAGAPRCRLSVPSSPPQTVKAPRKIQIPATTRPTRAASHSNLLDQDPPRQTRRYSDGSDNPDARRYRSNTPDRNGHGNTLPLMSSGYKRLPNQEVSRQPIRTTLRKKRINDEYGLKLGSQIFIKHMTETGLAAKEGTLQEGDLILKVGVGPGGMEINGMTTENLSLLETKHLVEKSRGKLTMTVLRDDRKFLVSIPEVVDSTPNSEEDRQQDSSSELEDISDIEEDILPQRTSRQPNREKRTRRSMSGVSTLPNPRSSPVVPTWSTSRPTSSAASRPRRPVSESDSDHSSTPPPHADSRYKVLPDLPQAGMRNSPITVRSDPPRRLNSPIRVPPPDSESESDDNSVPLQRHSTSYSQDPLSRYRVLPEVAVEPPQWSAPSLTAADPPQKARSDSGSEASYEAGPRRSSTDSADSRKAKTRYRKQTPNSEMTSELACLAPHAVHVPLRVLLDVMTTSVEAKPQPARRAPSPVRQAPPDGGSPPLPRSRHVSGVLTPVRLCLLQILQTRTSWLISGAKPAEEPIYSLPPDSYPSSNPGYSSDVHTVKFVKEDSVGLRLVGGNDVGIFVGGVQPNSPAYDQGMKEGDQIMQVNNVDFGHFTREEAANFLLNIRKGEQIQISTQHKMDIYKKIIKSNLADNFYIRTHFDHEADNPIGLSFTRGEVFRVVDTMHRGKLGSWLAVRMGNDLHEMDKGIIPNQARAETLARLEQTQRASGERQVSGPRAEFWKLRGLRGNKKNEKTVRRSRDDLLQLTIQGKFPAYERVLLREANFKRPIVIMGPLNDIAMEKLAREMPDEYEVADMVPRSGADSSSTVIKLETVRRIAEKDKHPLLDITPTAVERLNYIQYHPMVLFLDPHSRKDIKAMRQRYSPNSNKSSRRLYSQALKLRKHCSHLFSARIDMQPGSHAWYESLKDKIRHQQTKPVWVSE